MTRHSADVLTRFAQLGAATLHEVTGPDSACDPGIRPIWTPVSMCGPAFTVRGWPADNLAIHQALARVPEGHVLVVDVGGHLRGYWGEVLTVAAQARGVAGLVIEGGVRDTAAIRDLGFPVFARGVALSGTGKFHPATMGDRLTIGGVVVEQGDVVVGDDDGVAIVPAGEADQCLQRAETRVAKETEWMEAIRNGATTIELLGLSAPPQ